MNSQNNKEQTLYVEGMHCASCEIILEKKLLKQAGVQAVDASLDMSELRVVIDKDISLNIDALNTDLTELGYRISTTPIQNKVRPLFITDSDGNKTINKEKAQSILKNVGIAIIVILAFIFVEKAQLGRFISVDQGAALSAFLILGLVASVSSCAALIGGVLLSLSKHWHEQYGDSADKRIRTKPHILFHGGRLASFFVLGGILGAVGDAISLDNTILYAGLVMLISAVMILIALQMLGVKWAQRFSIRMPKAVTRMAAREQSGPSFIMPAVAGALTFFLPCGFTLIAQGAALASGDPITGAYIMTFFAIGTLPVLAGISFSGVRFTSKPHLAARFSLVAGILVFFFGIYNINGQLNVLGYPSVSDFGFFQPNYDELIANTESDVQAPQGEQWITLVAKGFNYIPIGTTNFTAGMPTKLVVDNQGVLGCGAFIASAGLFDSFVALNPGQNIIDIGTPRPGTYKITCSMGMVPPVTINIQ